MCYFGCIAHFQIVELERNILCAAFVLLCLCIVIIVQMRGRHMCSMGLANGTAMSP